MPLCTYYPAIVEFSHYLAALLVGCVADVPVPADGGVIFGTVSLLQQQPDGELKAATFDFFTVSNAVKLLFGRKTLEEILATNGQPVARYGAALLEFSNDNAELRSQLVQRNDSARMLAGVDTIKPFSHTLALLEELRNADEWDTLRQQAERHIRQEDPFRGSPCETHISFVSRPVQPNARTGSAQLAFIRNSLICLNAKQQT